MAESVPAVEHHQCAEVGDRGQLGGRCVATGRQSVQVDRKTKQAMRTEAPYFGQAKRPTHQRGVVGLEPARNEQVSREIDRVAIAQFHFAIRLSRLLGEPPRVKSPLLIDWAVLASTLSIWRGRMRVQGPCVNLVIT